MGTDNEDEIDRDRNEEAIRDGDGDEEDEIKDGDGEDEDEIRDGNEEGDEEETRDGEGR